MIELKTILPLYKSIFKVCKLRFSKIFYCIFLIIISQIYSCQNQPQWEYIGAYSTFENKFFYDENSISRLEDKNILAITLKSIYTVKHDYSGSGKKWDYQIQKYEINCITNEIRSGEVIVYYTNGENSGWHDFNNKFNKPRDYFVEIVNIICSKNL